MKINDVIGNKYEVTNIITDTEDSSVGKCINKYLNNEWIIKFVPLSACTISNEVENMLKFNHKSIPKIVDVIKEEKGYYYVMNNIKGHTIGDYTKIFKYDLSDIKKWAIELVEVLKHIHCYDIIHGDIKDTNIMIDDYKSLYLIDFGSSFTKVDRKSFTKRYIAPERLVDHFTVDERSDLFSFGIVFKDIISDYTDKNYFKKYFKIKNLKKISKIIRKCTEINPENRHQSAVDIYEALIDL